MDDDSDTIQCPYCLKEVYEDAEQCPHCGNYLSLEDQPSSAQQPIWIYVGAVLCFVVIFFWIFYSL